MSSPDTLTIALSKGRIFKDTLPLLSQAGIEPIDDPETSRKLILDTSHPQVKFVLIRATDVPTYVQWGAADIGVAGKDVLMEHGGDGLLKIGGLPLLDDQHRALARAERQHLILDQRPGDDHSDEDHRGHRPADGHHRHRVTTRGPTAPPRGRWEDDALVRTTLSTEHTRRSA